jgi:hypothetical protein
LNKTKPLKWLNISGAFSFLRFVLIQSALAFNRFADVIRDYLTIIQRI